MIKGDEYMSIGEELRRYRKKRNLTMEELSKLSGVSKYTISRYENEYGVMRIDVISKLAVVLGLDISIEFHERRQNVRGEIRA